MKDKMLNNLKITIINLKKIQNDKKKRKKEINN